MKCAIRNGLLTFFLMSLLAHYRGNVIQGGMRMGKEHPIGKEGLSFACQMVGTFD